MQDKKGRLMNKDEFIKSGLYAKEHYEGLLISSDTKQGCYNIGVQLDDNTVLVVDQAKESNVRERIQTWAPQIQEIQRGYSANPT